MPVAATPHRILSGSGEAPGLHEIPTATLVVAPLADGVSVRRAGRTGGGAATTPNRVAACISAIVVVVLVPSGAGAAGHPAPDVVGRRTVLLGRSSDGRPITAVETGDFDSPRKALVVGCIHGDECAGTAIAARLAHRMPPANTDLWIVPDANPDGRAAGTRGNAHAVDLNRNFPWRWQPLGGATDSGPGPLSERETRILYRLLRRLRPGLSIWFHQPLDLVDDASGNHAIERRFATAAGLRVEALPSEPGSAVTWETHCLPRGSAFVVELPAGRASGADVRRLTRATLLAVASTPTVRPTLSAACSSSR
jgi:murein peptide amidase A